MMNELHKKQILDNIEQLVELTDYNKLNQMLLQNGIITETMMKHLISDFPDEKDQHRQLFIKITYRGPNAYKILRSILAGISTEASDLLHAAGEISDVDSYVTRASQIGQDPILGTYDMNRRDRGLFVFVNNVKFDDAYYRERHGAYLDTEKLQTLFKVFQFETQHFSRINLTREEFKLLIKEVKSSPLLQTIQCLVFVLASHGLEESDEIVFKDGTSLKADDIVKEFGNKACPELAKKPKIFIFPYCRGNHHDEGVEHNEIFVAKEIDPMPAEKSHISIMACQDMKAEDDIREDMVVCFATLPGDVSSRETDSGSWYLTDLYKIFAKHAHNNDLATLLRMVAKETMQRLSTTTINKNGIIQTKIKQTPHAEYYYFNNSLYFNPGLPN